MGQLFADEIDKKLSAVIWVTLQLVRQ